MSRLNLPAVKFLISDLITSEAIPSTQADICSWLHGHQQFSIVWIQGEVVQVGDGYLVLDDNTGQAEVDTSQSNLPRCGLHITEGSYAMVVGELQHNTSPVRIKAIKVQDLSKDALAQELWRVEIQDLHQYGLQQILPAT